MERLTYRGRENKAYCDYDTRDIINKLAEYEDTGLTPTMVLDTIKERNIAQKQAIENSHIVDEYLQLEEQGLLLRLPCKEGDIVYALDGKNIQVLKTKKTYCLDKRRVMCLCRKLSLC